MYLVLYAIHQPIVYHYCQTRDIEGACGQLAIKSQPKSKSTLDIEDLGGNRVTTMIKNKLPTRVTTPSPSSTKNTKISGSVQNIADESNISFIINNISVVLLLMGGAIASLGMVVSGLRMKYRLKLNA